MGLKVVFTYAKPGFPTHEEVFTDLEVEVVKAVCHTEDELISVTADADGVVAPGARTMNYFSRRVIENLEKCRIIACAGVGYDNVDLSAATEQGVCVSNVPDYCFQEVSDLAMALILACARKLYKVLPEVKAGKWGTEPELRRMLPPLSRLRGQTLGLIGFGNIARTLVPKARAFGFRVIAHDPFVPASTFRVFEVESVDFARLLAESDFVSLHVALTPQNMRMIGLEQFKKMKPTAYFINTARGQLVDEQALYNALSQGLIAGAGLDVMGTEPPGLDNPLLNLDNVFITGHTGQYSDQGEHELWLRPWEEIARVLHGELPQALVNPQVKEKFFAKWGKK